MVALEGLELVRKARTQIKYPFEDSATFRSSIDQISYEDSWFIGQLENDCVQEIAASVDIAYNPERVLGMDRRKWNTIPFGTETDTLHLPFNQVIRERQAQNVTLASLW